MTLSSRLVFDFPPGVRKRGEGYFFQGKVQIRHGSDREVEARVVGSRLYDVGLDLTGGTLSAWCDCAYFDGEGPCKHLWATILAADADGHLAAAQSVSKLNLDLMGDELDDRPEGPLTRARQVRASLPKPKEPAWRKKLGTISGLQMGRDESWPAKRHLRYVVDAQASQKAGCLVLALQTQDRKPDGSWASLGGLSLKRSQISHLPCAVDREILAVLAGSREHNGYFYRDPDEKLQSSCEVTVPAAMEMVVREAARAGSLQLRSSWLSDPSPLGWDDGEPWQFGVEIEEGERRRWILAGVLRRGEEVMELDQAALILPGFVFTRERVARLAAETPFACLSFFRREGEISAPEKDGQDLLEAALCTPGLPPPLVPEQFRYEEVLLQPRPSLRFKPVIGSARLSAEVCFDYGGQAVAALDTAQGFYDRETRRFLRRDRLFETAAAEKLQQAGLRFQRPSYGAPFWDIAPTKLPGAVRALLDAGWHVEAEGKIFRQHGEFRMGVSTGVDWFELSGEVDYGEAKAHLPELLQALRKGESMVLLSDGSYGMLPEQWLRRIGLVAGMGSPEDGHIRFRPSQAGLLDALLACQPESTCDETFERLRAELKAFDGVAAAEQPSGFSGQLRDYQREGLGWMHFLRRFSFGGCLADDMGVGKTAQVLALLETRRQARAAGEPALPSLVVVPRSLVFNWKCEAERFTPALRLLDYTGMTRNGSDFAACDVVLTTYGTLRRDAALLKDIAFDYVVLDEAQAVKNASTETSKAVRLLRGKHRLALSGTPIENHLGELWTLFEFLNPGMLGAASVFKRTGDAVRNPDEETRRMLAQALRPFILRRTKDQVARELPLKTEQTVYCEMEPDQRRLYNELRDHYRDSLLQRIETEGLAKSKIQVLEALLRLRQASCHPGLIDPKRAGNPSAKLEVLLDRLAEVLERGHKALVFSQFTSLLAIVRDRLEKRRIAYEYLDGATQDRQARVERFQNDPDCRLFLISLRAGGLGLNLTAAEYVFLLDPWWNPAVEAQAVDRAHRIGQTRQVFAFRLIARDSVEEKVLELQKTKRDLAAAIISADNSLIGNLRREDLELLLS